MGSIRAASPVKRAATKASTSKPRAKNGPPSKAATTAKPAAKAATPKKPTPKTASAPKAAKKAAASGAAKSAKDPIAADIAFVKAQVRRIKTSFYDVGEALGRLKAANADEKLGHPNFSTFVKKEIRMSTQLADRLVAIATHISRELATQVGQRHAWSLVRLTRPVTLADPYPKEKRKKVTLPTGDVLKVPTAAARARMADAAASTKAERQKRGRTTTAVERYIGAEIDACLKAIGITEARIRTVATRPGKVANLRIELPLSDLEAVCQVVCPK